MTPKEHTCVLVEYQPGHTPRCFKCYFERMRKARAARVPATSARHRQHQAKQNAKRKTRIL